MVRIVAGLFLTMLLGTMAAAQTVPFPDPVVIKPPAAGLAPEVAAFSGVWEGRWGGVLASRLAVEEIDAEIAVVVYGWADHPGGAFRGGWSRIRARVVPPTRIEWGDGERSARFIFQIRSDQNSIEGTRRFRDQFDTIVMTRKKP